MGSAILRTEREIENPARTAMAAAIERKARVLAVASSLVCTRMHEIPYNCISMEPIKIGSLAAWVHTPQTRGPLPARVLLVHGMGEHSERHRNTIDYPFGRGPKSSALI